jgi:hypothetical protein
MSVRRDRCRSVAAGWFDARSRSIRAGRLSSMSSRPSAQSSTQHQVENLAASLKRVSRQKKVLEDWTATLERTVGAHEQVTREREATRAAEIASEQATVLAEQQAHAAEIASEQQAHAAEIASEQATVLAEQQAHAAEIASEQAAHCAELRVRSQELAAVDRRLRRTLESQSFRIGHLVVRIAVSPVKAARWSWRLVRRVLVAAYRLGQRTLPAPVVEPIQQVAAKLEVASIRRHEVLDLPGNGPVAFVDCRGLAADVRTAAYERIVASDEPVRIIVLTEDHDFTYLRELGLSFEYLPPFVEGTPWWDDVVDHERFVAERMVAMRLGYGADDF